MSEKWEIVGKAKKSKSSVTTKDSTDKKGSPAKKPTYDEIRKHSQTNKLSEFV